MAGPLDDADSSLAIVDDYGENATAVVTLANYGVSTEWVVGVDVADGSWCQDGDTNSDLTMQWYSGANYTQTTDEFGFGYAWSGPGVANFGVMVPGNTYCAQLLIWSYLPPETLLYRTEFDFTQMAATAVTLSAPSSGTAGSPIAPSTIQATLSGGSSPTGTLTFTAFGPQSSAPTSCSSGGTTFGTAAVSGNGTYSPTTGFTPPTGGDYWWYVSYGGDANNGPSVSICDWWMMPAVTVSNAPPVNTILPAIADATTPGAFADGDNLTTTDGTWTGDTPMTPTYQWYRGTTNECSATDTPVGAGSPSYAITAEDIGHELCVAVTETNDVGAATAVSATVFAAPTLSVSDPRMDEPAAGQTESARFVVSISPASAAPASVDRLNARPNSVRRDGLHPEFADTDLPRWFDGVAKLRCAGIGWSIHLWSALVLGRALERAERDVCPQRLSGRDDRRTHALSHERYAIRRRALRGRRGRPGGRQQSLHERLRPERHL